MTVVETVSRPVLSHPATLRALLQKHGMWAKKQYSQNFLVSESALLDIVDAAEILPTDFVLEIGPGPGALTQKICDRAGSVLALELDSAVFPVLHEALVWYTNWTVLQCDALAQPAPDHPYKLVTNLPYAITGKVLRKFFVDEERQPDILVMTLQKEVVEELVGTSKKQNALGLFARCYGVPSCAAVIPAHCFLPAPKVDSAIFVWKKSAEPVFPCDTRTRKQLSEMLRRLFLHPRKKLTRNVALGFGLDIQQAESLLQTLNISWDIRPEHLTPSDLARLFPVLQPLGEQG